MPANFLVPETKVEESGSGEKLELGSSAGQPLVLTLGITDIVEQESLDVSIWGSTDGNEWGQKPLTSFPQKFYAGVHAIILDLTTRPEVRFLQAKWQVARWGVGSTKPMFTFYLFVEPIRSAASP